MSGFNYDLVMQRLQEFSDEYHLSNDSLDWIVIYTIVHDNLSNNVPLQETRMNLLEYLSPGLYHYALHSGITYPYDMDLEVKAVLIDAGYPDDEEELENE